MAATVYLVEDDESLATLIDINLRKDGYHVRHLDNGEDGLFAIRDGAPDLVLLDWMLPDLSGVEITRRLRHDARTRAIPIIMLTARGEEDDRVTGLEAGADDYVSKPFSFRELQSRIKSQLRRTGFVDAESRRFGDIEIDSTKRRVKRQNRELRVGAKEFALLELLTARPGRVFTREMLLDQLWSHDVEVELRTVDVTIGRLRRALRRGDERDPIRTVRGLGYAWDETF